jgi:hypothetical protein
MVLTGLLDSYYHGSRALLDSYYHGTRETTASVFFLEEFLFLAKVAIIPKEELAKYGYKRI